MGQHITILLSSLEIFGITPGQGYKTNEWELILCRTDQKQTRLLKQ